MLGNFYIGHFTQRKCRIVVISLLATFSASGATAQSSTNCMRMGDNMVHCNTLDMSTTQPNHDGGAALGRGIGNLIAAGREKSFRKKVGKMLASGDCQGAAAYAYKKGRLRLGGEIAQACNSKQQQASESKSLSIHPDNLEVSLQRIAANSKTPMAFDEITTVSKVEALGKQLLFTAIIDASDISLSETKRIEVANLFCAAEATPSILKAGASMRVTFADRDGNGIGAVMINRDSCGL